MWVNNYPKKENSFDINLLNKLYGGERGFLVERTGSERPFRSFDEGVLALR